MCTTVCVKIAEGARESFDETNMVINILCIKQNDDQFKAHFLLSSLLKFYLICDKGGRINCVFNLASDFHRVTGPFFSGRSQCHTLDRS